jgi:opacity protein-like surface antigen
MRLQRTMAIAIFVGALFGSGTSAFADITGFLGLAGGPSLRGAKGVAVGVGLVIVGVELEYSDTGDDLPGGAPRIRTGMANGLLQTPVPIAGMQFYATAGGGIYHHELGGLTETNVGINVGGGIKKKLIGPLRIRIDYRYFRFSGSPIGADGVHRVYVGANIKF